MACLPLQHGALDLGVCTLVSEVITSFTVIRNYDRMVNDYLGYSLNWTLPQMILCCKLCSVAWNYHDGQTAKERNTSLKHKLDEFQTKQMLPELPHPIEFFGYAFFFCGFLTGPWSDYRDYVDFTSRKMFKAEGGKIPNSILFVLKRLVMIAIALVGFKLSDDYNVKWTLTPEWMTFPLWKRCLLHIVVVELFYCKYYVVWWLGEGACSVIGISYNGRDEKGRVKWDRIRMVDIVKFKFAKSITRDMVPNWNIMSQHWLNRYVHRRFVGLGLSRTTSRYTTFLVSALWHGLYPGYYLFFIQCAVFMSIADLLHEMAMPFFTKEDGTPKYPQQYLLNVLVPISTLACLDYLAITFQLMAFSYAIQSLTTTYWIGHIFMLGVLITYFVTKPFRKSQKKRDYKVINIDDQSISTTKSLADKKR